MNPVYCAPLLSATDKATANVAQQRRDEDEVGERGLPLSGGKKALASTHIDIFNSHPQTAILGAD